MHSNRGCHAPSYLCRGSDGRALADSVAWSGGNKGERWPSSGGAGSRGARGLASPDALHGTFRRPSQGGMCHVASFCCHMGDANRIHERVDGSPPALGTPASYTIQTHSDANVRGAGGTSGALSYICVSGECAWTAQSQSSGSRREHGSDVGGVEPHRQRLCSLLPAST
eukprot:scaffold2761_cov391-Prasinococcus_capsulatus_cf.AAC.8